MRDCAQVMGADASFHADQARRYIGEPRFHLATRPFLPQHDGAARIVAHDVERVLADIDADHGDCGIGCLRQGVLLVFWRPLPAWLAGGAGARPDHPINGRGSTNIPATTLAFNMVASIRGTIAIAAPALPTVMRCLAPWE